MAQQPAAPDLGNTMEGLTEIIKQAARSIVDVHGLTGPIAKAAPMAVIAQALGQIIAEDAGDNHMVALQGIGPMTEMVADEVAKHWQRLHPQAEAGPAAEEAQEAQP